MMRECACPNSCLPSLESHSLGYSNTRIHSFIFQPLPLYPQQSPHQLSLAPYLSLSRSLSLSLLSHTHTYTELSLSPYLYSFVQFSCVTLTVSASLSQPLFRFQILIPFQFLVPHMLLNRVHERIQSTPLLFFGLALISLSFSVSFPPSQACLYFFFQLS